MTAMQGSIGEVPCRDKEDARTRVYDARQGSLINPSPEYMQELQLQLHLWMQAVDQAVAQGIQQAITQEDNQTESYHVSIREETEDESRE